MSKIRIYGDTSGYVDISAPDNAGNRTLNLDEIPQTDTSGNTGIGTESPNYKLEVWSGNTIPLRVTGAAAADTSYSVFRNTASGAVGNGVGLELRANSSTQERQLLYIESEWSNSTDASRESKTRFLTSGGGTQVVPLTLIGDKVGIGTASGLTQPLHVYAAAPTNGVVAKFQTPGNPWIQNAGGNSSWQTGSTQNGWELYNDNNTAYRVIVTPGGNVGIGTNRAANFKMHINKRAGNYTPTNGVVETLFGVNTSYDANGTQGVYISNLDGNWQDGTAGADSQYGLVYGFENNVRAGLVYDHRGTERMTMWSAYGRIGILTGDTADADGVPTDSNVNERISILPGGKIGIGITNPSANASVTIGGNWLNSYSSTIYLDNNNTGGADGWINTTDDSWTLKTNAQQGGVAIGTGTPQSSTARIHIGNDGTVTIGKNVSSFVGSSGDSAAHVHTTGPVSIGHNSDQSEWRKGGRVVKGWYAVGYRDTGIGNGIHIVTDLWGGGSPSGNSDYIMGGFEIRGHRYSTGSSVAHHFIYFHNWGGSTGSGYSVSSSGNWDAAPTAYVNSSGYVTIRVPNASYYGFIIDLHQYNWYPLRNITVTSVTVNSAATI